MTTAAIHTWAPTRVFASAHAVEPAGDARRALRRPAVHRAEELRPAPLSPAGDGTREGGR